MNKNSDELTIKTFFKSLILIFLVLSVSTCERDDICPEDVPTTPRLIIEFFDISNQESNVNVPSFRAQGVGNEAPLDAYSGSAAAGSIELPLKTNENSTSYSFIRDYEVDEDGVVSGNEDVITINYALENVYVSRACGYKTVFRNVNIIINGDSDLWIVLAQPINDNQSVEDETETHFKLFIQ
ncbi:DUF6452 family protein [Psychroserpens sp. XS_ASV72]|uniref:DUF6452 family protein n=1 Tax=Psychroserpens sp. XS_ASV72 TaxID=3241293 RepID=UPI00351149A9